MIMKDSDKKLIIYAFVMALIFSEIWSPVAEYEDYYEVSTNGNVRSLDRMKDGPFGSSYEFKGRLLKLQLSHGYQVVGLYDGKSQKTKRISRLVAKAFLPEYSESLHVDHRKGNRSDNRSCSLRMTTREQNCRAFNLPRKATSSIYRGVSWASNVNKWRARISPDKKSIHIGLFENERDAAIAWNLMAKQLGYFPESFNII